MEPRRLVSVRWIRYAVVLVTGIIAGGRVVDAVQAWSAALRAAVTDPSAAEAYRTFALVDAAVAVGSLAVAGLVWWLLRPGSPSPERQGERG
jgi:hypothetical protein